MAEGKFNEIHGWAAMEPGMKVEPWSYTPRPLGDRDIEIKIEYSGICGSDIHINKNDWGNSEYPQISGHEIVGKVVAKGPRVKHFELGDTVGVGGMCYACRQDDCRPCKRGLEQHCPKCAYIIGGRYPDGVRTHGGFAEAVRVNEYYASKIPAAIDPAYAPPLMCAGLTVFAPMVNKGVKRGDRVGIVGIGGLGHLAIQFAAALGAEVVAISHSPSKREQCMELGVTQFVDTSNREEAEALRKSLDFLFVCSTAGAEKYNEFITWMACESQIVILGLPSEPLKVYPGELVFSGTSISGSQIGGLSMTRKTLEFAAKHNIRPMIERFPIAKINEAMEHVESGKVRYRAVLEL
ncbi:hypothetical protein H4R18_001165 [Coemansia javaensis]|uniref:Enoyl reductase (ER) domain-containing protein n=1 Tax=Coemansia javaensis TaxID=2761396 RepID=A0A9W8HEL1_9FUNG|nr:hypothetical protein H4R18_001165 [Coemansia javaensis]